MHFIPTTLPEVIIVEPPVFGDQRGFFMETYQQRKFSEAGIDATFVQDNHSGSQQGILRGLHYQTRQAQGKLVRTAALYLVSTQHLASAGRRCDRRDRWRVTIMNFPRPEFYVVIERDEDGFYVGEVPQLRACYSQGRTIDELMANMRDVIALCLEEEPEYHPTEFVGVQRVLA